MRRSLYTHTIDTLRNSIEQRTGSRGGRFEQDAEILTELADKAELEFRTMFQNDQWEPEDLAKGADTIGKKWAASPSVVRNIQQRKKAKVKEQAEKNTADALADIKSLRDAGKEDEAIAKAEEYMDRGVIAQWQLEGKPDPRLATELQKPKFNWKKLFLGD
jgi:hypothetical protein